MESDEIYLAECLDCIKRIFILDDNISPAALINSFELLRMYFKQNIPKCKKSRELLGVCLIWISHKFHDDDSADMYMIMQRWMVELGVSQIVIGEMQVLRRFAWKINVINCNDLCERLLKNDSDAEMTLEADIDHYTSLLC